MTITDIDENVLHVWAYDEIYVRCKMQILVSLGVFGTESHYICPFRYRLGLCIKKFTKKNAVMSSSLVWLNLGASLSLSHTHNGLP